MLRKLIAALIFISILPILILIGFVVFVLTRQNPIFKQERGLTLTKFRFRIYKFRTMLSNEENRENQAALYKIVDRNCIYPFGNFLRKTGLDELPQLINIIKGEMNFIGPRPLDLMDLKNIKNDYSELYIQRQKIDLLPGVTGYWQIYKDRDKGIQNLIELDKYYQNNKSYKLDLKIMLKSLVILFKAKHKDSISNRNENRLIQQTISGLLNYQFTD